VLHNHFHVLCNEKMICMNNIFEQHRSRKPLQTLPPTSTSHSQAPSTSRAVTDGSIYTDLTDTNHLPHEEALLPTVMHRAEAAKPTATDNVTNSLISANSAFLSNFQIIKYLWLIRISCIRSIQTDKLYQLTWLIYILCRLLRSVPGDLALY
jgi:hypothetical protein